MIIERIKNKESKINFKKESNNCKVQQNKTKPYLNDSYNRSICANDKNNIKGKLKSFAEIIKNKWKKIGIILGTICLSSVIIGKNSKIKEEKITKNKTEDKQIKRMNSVSFGSTFTNIRKTNRIKNYSQTIISQERIKYLKNKFKSRLLSEQEFAFLIKDEYARLRSIGPYKKNYSNNFSDYIQNIQTAIDYPQNPYIKLIKQNGWTYRIYNDIPTNQIGQRISLNVKGDSTLIRELDLLMTQGKYRDKSGRIYRINPTDFYYKTYEDASMWGTREDPITMYFRGDVNYQTLNAIGQIASKYVRGSLNNASKEVPFLVLEQNPTNNMVINLINTAMRVNSNLGNAILKNTSIRRGNEYVLSSGQYNAYKNILNEYIEFLRYAQNN